jgi:hypothetical protein
MMISLCPRCVLWRKNFLTTTGAYSGESDRVFRRKAIGCSGPKRSSIPACVITCLRRREATRRGFTCNRTSAVVSGFVRAVFSFSWRRPSGRSCARCVCVCRVWHRRVRGPADGLVPVADGELCGGAGGSAFVAVFHDFEAVAAFFVRQGGRHEPFIESAGMAVADIFDAGGRPAGGCRVRRLRVRRGGRSDRRRTGLRIRGLRIARCSLRACLSRSWLTVFALVRRNIRVL